MAPFAGYRDFAACVAANKDKESPERYCGAIKHMVEKSAHNRSWVQPQKLWIPISKTAEPERLVFGWANVSIAKSTGKQFNDLEEQSFNPVALEHAAYDFMLEFGGTDAGGVNHTEPALSRIVESFVATPEKLEAMGLAPDALPTGWWSGWKVPPRTFERVISGELAMFSVEGTGLTIPRS